MTGIEERTSSTSVTTARQIHHWHEWEIQAFSGCIRAEELKSSSFIIKNYGMNEWHLRIQYNHNSEYSLSLEMNGEPKPFEIDLKLGIIDANKSFLHAYESRSVLRNVHGNSSFMTHKQLHDKANNYLDRDTLRIGCMINMTGPVTIDKTEISAPVPQLSYDFSKVFDDPTTGDIVLTVGALFSRDFNAHKIILTVCSSVFAAEVKTLQAGEKMVITDLTAEVFEQVLKFIYTDKVDQLDEMTRELLHAANKYDLQKLKGLCEKALYKDVNIESAAEILMLADRCCASNLKRFVGSFIASHLREVSMTKNYEIMKANHPMLVLEIVEATGMLQNMCISEEISRKSIDQRN